MKLYNALLLSFSLLSSVSAYAATATPSYGDCWKKPVIFENSTNEEIDILCTSITDYKDSIQSSGKRSITCRFVIAPHKTTEKNRHFVDFFNKTSAVFTCILKIKGKETKAFKVTRNSKALYFILSKKAAEITMSEVS